MPSDLSEEMRVLIRDIGDAGVEQMESAPGLAAAVDQHVAAVRDAVEASGESLMDYLQSFTDSAFERGWWPDDTHDWEFVRVVAVCWMMRQTSSS